ncbi:MAG: VCBS repeat-containing protein [Verrucomicrobia bacterium]|nr:VCBS repeat-containing protein [Verrucomicrobiota bacterium]
MNDPNKPKRLSVRHFQSTTWRGPVPVAGFIWLLLSLSLLGQSTVQFSNTSMLVGENAGQAVATVRRANDLHRIVTVDYSTVDATATAGEDYVATAGTVTFAAGQTNQTIVVPILNDGRVEGSEVVQITLSNPGEGALLGSRIAVNIRLVDNDTGPYFASAVNLTVEDVGSVLLGVHRGDDGDQPVTVDYVTADGTALAGTDYTAAQGTLSFQGNETFKEIPVVIVNDGVNNPDKSFQVQLSNASSGGVGNPSLTSVIIQNSTPVIYAEPTPATQSVSLGAAVRIQVTAKGARMQWQKRVGEGEFTDIPGATGQVLEWSSATVDLSGEYRFVVSSSTGESVTSQVFAVTVDPTFTKITEGPVVNDAVSSWSGMFGDYDGDGLLDLVVLGDYWNAGANTRLYHNEGHGQFRAVTDSPWNSLTGRILYSPWADPDNDGDLDLLLVGYEGDQPIFMENGGGGIFTRLTVGMDWTSNQIQVRGWATAWGDLDNDGLLDAVVGAQQTYPMRNNGDGTFTVMTDSVIYQQTGSPHCYHLIDYDGDGDLDLFMPEEVMNSRLYRNAGQWQFTDVTQTVLQGRLGRGLNGAWADYDNDGDVDLYFMGYEDGPERFLLNNGDGTFAEWSGEPNSLLLVGNGLPVWGDYDNDGFLDLLITGPGHCRIFRNTTDGNLVEVMVGSPVSDPSYAQSAAWADYDNDGDLDLFVACHSSRNYLYQNNGNANNWLKVRLKGTASNSHGVGAKVFALTTEGLDARQMRQITAGSVSQELEAHFGLGDATKVDTLRIEWPSGIVQELKDVAVDQILQLVESQGLDLPEPLSIQTFELDATGVFHATMNCPVDGAVCVLESSSDLERWSKVKVGTISGGTVELTDAHAVDSPTRFYRVLVP